MGLFLSLFSLIPFEFFARGGGGGSGGSSGGGGGAGIVLIGYVPMHFLGAGLRRFLVRGEAVEIVVSIIGWMIALIYGVLLIGLFGSLGFFIAPFALIGMGAGLYSWFTKVKESSLIKNRLQQAASQDGAWDETKLVTYVSATFMKYQQDWSRGDTDAMRAYMTESYHYHASLLVYTLQQMKRKNVMDNVTIRSTAIQSFRDAENNNEDTFTIAIEASATDQLIDTQTDATLFTDTSPFLEYWTFIRNGDSWPLDRIGQATADAWSKNAQLEAWARQYGYRYSEDMGWLFIPKRGQLFDGAKFGTSDINNHVVGLYNNQLLVQIYSYVKDPAQNNKSYVIAQVNVPRTYGNIVVRRKKALQLFGIRGLERVETEWTQFNRKYEVYASSAEQATSFELLNPTYMEQLEALPFEVSIEVVDNVIYLFTNERGSDIDTYTTMLDLINKAFKEMRL